MAHSALRLRRSLPITAILRRSLSTLVPALSSPPLLKPSISFSSQQQSSSFMASIAQSRPFRSYPTVSLSSNKTYHLYKEGDDITKDTILFEGCDYNHWAILMDFPKDSKLTPEEMVKIYEETCAKGLNISLEEAKQKIYACSTTNYYGFQAVMTDQESEKFQGLPGVILVLPDSYIDAEKKEYAGDKYINGTIIPRQDCIQHNTEGRLRDQNKNPDRPPRNYQEGGPMQNQQNYPQNDLRQGDGRNHGAPQNNAPQQNYPPQQNFPPQQIFGTPSQEEKGGPMPMNPNRRELFLEDIRGLLPPHLRNYNQGEQGNYYPPKGNQSGYGERNFVGNYSNYALPSNSGNFGTLGQGERGGPKPMNPNRREFFQGDRRGLLPPHPRNYNQGEQGNYYPLKGNQNGFGERNFAGNYSNYALPSHSGNFGTPGQGERGGPIPMNPNRMESFQGDRRGLLPLHPRNYNQGEQGNYYPPQGNQSGYGDRNFVGNYSNYALPSHSGNFGTPGQGERGGPMPMNPNRRESFQGDRRGLLPLHPRNYNQGEQGNYYPPQGNQSGYGERNFVGNYSNYALPAHSGTYWQGTSSNYGQSYGGQGENQRFSPMEWGNIQGEQRNYAPMGQTGTDQGERGNYYPPQGDQSGYGERNFAGNYSNYALLSQSGTHWQGTSSYYGQSYGGQGENQRFSPMERGNIHQGERGNYFPPQGNQSSYGERNFVGNYSNYALPSHGGTYGQGTSSNYGQSYGGQGENHRFLPMEQGNVQGVPRNYAPMGQTVTNQGERGNYYPPRGSLSGYGERNLVGHYLNYAPPSHCGTYGQGTYPICGHSYEGQGGNQRFSPMEQRNVQGELRNYAHLGQTWTNQGRY